MRLKTGFLFGAVLALGVPNAVHGQSRINPDDLIGSWQMMTRKNLRTGSVDSVANKRLVWFTYTRNTYTVLEMDLTPSGTSREQLRGLAPPERQRRHLEAAHYTARGGTYRLEGNVMHFSRVIALDPNEIGTTPTSNLAALSPSTMIRHTVPDSAGVVTEMVFRKVQ